MKGIKNFAMISCAMLIGLVGSSAAGMVSVQYFNKTCPDGTNSDANGDTCIGHLGPSPTPTPAP